MCIRDSFWTGTGTSRWVLFTAVLVYIVFLAGASRHMNTAIVDGLKRRFALDALVADLTAEHERANTCLLYTSDAADERSSVDLGGRRIIKKKKMTNIYRGHILLEATNHTRKTQQ